MQLLQSAWSEILETIVQNCFRKAGISEKAEDVLDETMIHLKPSLLRMIWSLMKQLKRFA